MSLQANDFPRLKSSISLKICLSQVSSFLFISLSILMIIKTKSSLTTCPSIRTCNQLPNPIDPSSGWLRASFSFTFIASKSLVLNCRSALSIPLVLFLVSPWSDQLFFCVLLSTVCSPIYSLSYKIKVKPQCTMLLLKEFKCLFNFHWIKYRFLNLGFKALSNNIPPWPPSLVFF